MSHPLFRDVANGTLPLPAGYHIACDAAFGVVGNNFVIKPLSKRARKTATWQRIRQSAALVSLRQVRTHLGLEVLP